MPELPEVETVRRSLEPHVIDRRVTSVVVRDRRLRRPIDSDFESRLLGRSFRSIARRGKYLLFALDDGHTLLAHLGMSGCLRLRARGGEPARHDHVLIELDEVEEIAFNDPRRFGVMRIGSEESFEELGSIGPDPMSTVRSADQWRSMLRGRRTAIKTLLMDQRFLAGIGNIYANEMLHEAGIRPRRMASRLSRREVARLEDAMHSVLDTAVELGGSSISDFRDARGKPGYFQIHHAVYDRKGAPCRRCATPIRQVVLGGRSTYYCAICQS